MNEAVKVAKSDKEPPESEVTTDIYKIYLEKKIRDNVEVVPLQNIKLAMAN